MNIRIPEDLVEFIFRKTGVNKSTIRKVLAAERLYYMRLIYGDNSS